MAAVSGPWLLVVLNGAVLVVAAGVAAYLLRGRSVDPAAAGATWREGTVGLAREVREAAEPTAVPADHDRVARRLLPLAGRIQRHVRAAPTGVEERTYRRLFELGVSCQRVAIEHRPGDALAGGPFLEDHLETLREEAAAVESAVETAG